MTRAARSLRCVAPGPLLPARDLAGPARALQVPSVLLRVRRAGRPALRHTAGRRARRLAAAALQPLEPRRRRLRRGPEAVPSAPAALAHVHRQRPPAAHRCLPGDPGVLARHHRRRRRTRWGWSIILLTFTVRLVILPLTFKGVKSMQRLQVLQPEMKRIQERYKDDKQRMNQEMMAFYQEQQGQSAGLLPPAAAADPVLHLALLPAALGRVQGGHRGQPELLLHRRPRREGHRRAACCSASLIVLYVGTQLIASLITTVSADKTQRRIMFALPFVFVDLHHQLRGGPDRLLDHHQRVDDRPAAAGAEALPEAGARRRGRRRQGDIDTPRAASRRARSWPLGGGDGDGAQGARTQTARTTAKAAKAAAAAGGNGRRAREGAAASPRKKKKRSGRRR